MTVGGIPLSPEYQVLLQCANTEASASSIEAIRSIVEGPFDWPLLRALALRHELDGFLALHLEDSALESTVPTYILDEIKRGAEENRVRFLYFVEPALGTVLGALASERIPVIALKGAALIRLVYTDLRLRQIGDLDLLLEEHNLERARELLLKLGYIQRELPRNAKSSPLDYHFCPRLLSPDGSVEIELHRHVVQADSPLYFDIEELWERSRLSKLANHPARVLSPVDLLTYLCLKFFLDRRLKEKNRGALRQLIDIGTTLRHYSTELEEVAFADVWDARPLQGPLCCSLWVAHELLDSPIPDENLFASLQSSCDRHQLEMFTDTKVLDSAPWLFHELVDPSDSARWNLTKALLRRFVPPSSYLAQLHPDLGAESTWRLYARHANEMVRFLGYLFGNPQSMSDNLEVDLWMNRLQLAHDPQVSSD